MTNDDMPWVNLTQEEVEDLRNKKHELTEYGKEKIKQLNKNKKIDEAIEELGYIVMGGQDMREYSQSIAFIMDVLISLKDKESDFEDSANGVA